LSSKLKLAVQSGIQQIQKAENILLQFKSSRGVKQVSTKQPETVPLHILSFPETAVTRKKDFPLLCKTTRDI